MAGKGDSRRPAAISDPELQQRWADTFGSTRPPVLTEDVLAAMRRVCGCELCRK